MALCFNTPLPELENELMQLILDGHIQARIDSINKVSFMIISVIFQLIKFLNKLVISCDLLLKQ